jgi:hypothetical protein
LADFALKGSRKVNIAAQKVGGLAARTPPHAEVSAIESDLFSPGKPLHGWGDPDSGGPGIFEGSGDPLSSALDKKSDTKFEESISAFHFLAVSVSEVG